MACERCSSPFTFYRRRHHCRRCGGVFCIDCAKEKVAGISGWSGAERICRICQTLAPATALAAQPRERTVVLLGSPGVGKSAIAQLFAAVGAAAPSDQQRDQPSAVSGGGPQQQNNGLGGSLGGGAGATGGGNSGGGAGAVPSLSTSSCARRMLRHRGGGDYVLALQDAIGHTHVGSFPPALAIAAHLFLLVFSVDDHASLYALRAIHQRVLDCGCYFVPMLVIGTTRGDSRVVPHEDCAAVAAEFGARHVEISLTPGDVGGVFDKALDLVAARD